MSRTEQWRVDGTPKETRYESVADAQAARRRVQRMVPNRTKGKKETGGRRPNRITCVRIHHSKGKKWEEFLAAMGFEQLSESNQLLLMDSFNNGGNELFAKWKQREWEKWTPIKRVIVLDYSVKGKIINIQLADGTVIEQPYESATDKKNKAKKARRAAKKGSAKSHCGGCGMRFPVSLKKGQCPTCSAALNADSFFKNLMKSKKVEK